jgi:regulator of sigma E protease
VVQLEDTTNPTWEDIVLKEVSSAKRPMQVWVLRAGERLHFSITPAYEERQGVGYAAWAQETDVQIAGYVTGIDIAEQAGIKKGDLLVSVNGQKIRSTSRLREVVDQTKDAPVDLVYSHEGMEHRVTLTPVHREVDGQERWMIGVALEPRLETTKLALPQAIVESCRQNMQSAKLIFKFLEGIVERRMSPKSLEGPIRIAQLSGQAAREGPATFFGLMTAVSLNLAIFNLLPVPILDGGVILLLLVEMLLRRDLDLRVKETVIKAGFVFLMMVVVFVLYNDISKIMPPG